MLHPFEMFGGTYILTEWRAFGSAFLFCEFTPLYGLNPAKRAEDSLLPRSSVAPKPEGLKYADSSAGTRMFPLTNSELWGKKEQCSRTYAEKHCSGWMYFSWRPGVKGRGFIPRFARRPAGSRGWPVCRCGRWAASGPAGFRGSSRAAGRGPGT